MSDTDLLDTSNCIVVTDGPGEPSLPWCEVARMANADHAAALAEIAALLHDADVAEMAAQAIAIAEKSIDGDAAVVARDDRVREAMDALAPIFSGGADPAAVFDLAVAMVDAFHTQGWLTIRWRKTNSGTATT